MPAAVSSGLAATRAAWELGGVLLTGLSNASRRSAAGSLLLGLLAAGGAVLPWTAAYEAIADAGAAASFRASSEANRRSLESLSAADPGSGFLPVAAGLLGGGGPGSQAGGGDLFEDCAEKLFDNSDDASRLARSRGLSKQDAEDVAMQALLKVCEEHQKTGVADLVPYYMKAVNYAAGRVRAKSARWRDLSDSQERYVQEPEAWRRDDREAVRRAFARLSEQDQRVILLSLQLEDHRAVAAALGISYAAARKTHSRAVGQLRTLVALDGN
jgi:RNA polymerase sigma factor (sigma-70 family)